MSPGYLLLVSARGDNGRGGGGGGGGGCDGGGRGNWRKSRGPNGRGGRGGCCAHHNRCLRVKASCSIHGEGSSYDAGGGDAGSGGGGGFHQKR